MNLDRYLEIAATYANTLSQFICFQGRERIQQCLKDNSKIMHTFPSTKSIILKTNLCFYLLVICSFYFFFFFFIPFIPVILR